MLGCGGSGAARGDGVVAPATDRDPPPFTPAPATSGSTGGAVGISLSGGYDQARGVARELVRAIRDADVRVLESLLADPLPRATPRGAMGPRSRDDVLTQLTSSRVQGIGPDSPLEQLARFDSIEVTTLEQTLDGQPVPNGMQPSDLVVNVPLEPAGQRLMQSFLGPRLTFILRPGIEPLVIAL